MFVHVAVETGSTSEFDALTYEVPAHLRGSIGLGSCVLVPLGNRHTVGYVIGFASAPEVSDVRPIISEIHSPVRLTDSLLRLAQWISDEYLCPLSHVLLSMIPAVMQYCVQEGVALCDKEADVNKLTPLEQQLLVALAASGGHCASRDVNSGEESFVSLVSLSNLGKKTSILKAVRQLEAKGLIRRTYRLVGFKGKPRMVRGVRISSGTLPVPVDLSDKQRQLLENVRQLGREVSISELQREFGISRAVIEALCKKGLLEEVQIKRRRVPAYVKMSGAPEKLTRDQQNAVDLITHSIDSGEYRGFLLHGVTASGKTEVYIRCIEHALRRGRSGLMLLPEIALTTQLMNVVKSRLGDEVAVLHSGLTAGERCDEWVRVQRGEVRVALGARSAVFAPLENLGIVIVDEEHEASYKQEKAPRYNGRDVAVHRARGSGAALVLGSATPSIESFYRAEVGEYELISMPTRIENRPLPEVRVVDLREEIKKRRSTVFSEELEHSIREHLARGRQIMLLQNRRAYSIFLLCRDCGYVPGCPNCAVTLKFRATQRELTCHHCEYHEPAPDVCPRCGGHRIKRFGIGTERVEEEAKRLFPQARVLRMDRDTTSRKGSHASILNQFRNGEADILVGTQMIAKGFDFPNVTVVGVISADTALHIPDFRAGERTFQLISQIAGRSGRGDEPGVVVVQTFDPENYAIRCAIEHDYHSFYRQELEIRRELGYPPFASLVNVVSHDSSDEVAEVHTREFAEECRRRKGSHNIEITGPVRSVLAKLRGEYRWHVVLRSCQRREMLALIDDVLKTNAKLRRFLAVDVDPISML
ncbi:MAG: primosomal protein N' [Armatimonadota bacterium]